MPPRRTRRAAAAIAPTPEEETAVPDSVPNSPDVGLTQAEALPGLAPPPPYRAPTSDGGTLAAHRPAPPRADDSVFKILISTDNHLGVHEKDGVRKDDSFVAFEEVLGLATTHGADTVLLGGDLFHENKPSREAVVRAMTALSSACLVGEGGEEDGAHPGVRFHVISPDPGAGLAAGAPNFTAPGHRVRLPVFSIHGNHDDPVGPGLLSAVDVLSSAGLVNYFGKRALEGSTAGTVVMSPILLQKGHTKIALYGLGNVRDERMARVLATPGAVAWERPANHDDFFSIFVLHQNRVPHGRAGARNTVQPRHLPEWLDFVVWGHEHESQPSPTDDPAGFMILQPGSTVATALSEGEAAPKHAFMLEVRGTDYRTTALPLRSVRPFAYASVALKALLPPGTRPDDAAAINAALVTKVDDMIRAAQRPGLGGGGGGGDAGAVPHALDDGRSRRPPHPPLVRLRVDYTGFTTLSSARLAGQFVGKVANPADLFLWVRAPAGGVGGGAGGGAGPAGARAAAAAALARAGEDGGPGGAGSGRGPAELDGRALAAVVAGAVGRLEVVGPAALGTALHAFVDKDERGSLADAVAAEVKATLDAAADGLKRAAAAAAEQAAAAAAAALQAAAADAAVGGGGGGGAAAAAAAAAAAGGRGRGGAADAASSALPTDEDVDKVLQAAAAARHAAATAAAEAAAAGGAAGGPSGVAAAEVAAAAAGGARPRPPATAAAAAAGLDLSPPGPSALQTQASGRPAARGRAARPAATAAATGARRAAAPARPRLPTASPPSTAVPATASRPRRAAAARGEARRAATAAAPMVDEDGEEDEEDIPSASDSDAAVGGEPSSSDDDEGVVDTEDEDVGVAPTGGRRRARSAGGAGAGRGRPAKRGRRAGASPLPTQTGGPPETLIVSSDEEEVGARRRGGGGGGGGGGVPTQATTGRQRQTQFTSRGWGAR